VPTMLQDLMEHPDFSKTDISSLFNIGSGGAHIAPSQVVKTREVFECDKRGTDTRNGYGLTETSGAIAFNNGASFVLKPTSCGQPFPIVEVKVVDDDGKEVPRGQRGHLLVRSGLVMKGYWNRERATTEVLCPKEGWFQTGDVAIFDEENFIHIVDRKKDIVIRGGENISCADVEHEIYFHPSVYECAVFGLPDERLGEVLGVVIVPTPGTKATAEEIFEFLKPRLAHFKIPTEKNIFFWNSPLIRGATGKIQKRDVKAQILAELNKSKL